MRRWQFLLELLIHHTPMADSLHLYFPLGRSGRLPLVACHFFLPWPRFAEDRIVLGNVSWQFGPSSFVFGHFFLLGVGLGLNMKWTGVAKLFGPTIVPQNPVVRLIRWGGGFWCPQASRPVESCPPWVPEPFHLPKAHSWHFGIWDAPSLMPWWSNADCFGIQGAPSLVPLRSDADLTVEDFLGNWAGLISLVIRSLNFMIWILCELSPSRFHLLYKAP